MPKPTKQSTGLASYLRVAGGQYRQSSAESYLRMVVSPFERENQTRYPDETLVPTSLAHFLTTATYTLTSGDNANGWSSILNSNLNTLENCINLPVTNGSFGPGSAGATYGAPQTTYTSLTSSDRTLAAGLRVRVTGLPVSTFIASGQLYFIQVDRTSGDQVANYANFTNGLSNCIQAVSAGKGFSVSAAELVGNSGIYIPYFPRGSNAFLFKDYAFGDSSVSTLIPANSLGTVIPAGAFGSNIPSSTVAITVPSTAATFSSNVGGIVAPDPQLIVVGWGMQAGSVVQVDYAHHVEYVPRTAAAGLTTPELGMSDVMARDSIHKHVTKAAHTVQGSTSRSRVVELYDAANRKSSSFLDFLDSGKLMKTVGAASTAVEVMLPLVTALLARR